MKVVFLTSITDSFGERQHAKSFANQLESEKINCFFISLHKNLDLYFKKLGFRSFFGTNILEIKKLLTKVKPDIIILCEYYHFKESFLDYLFLLKIPIATMDGTSIGKEINENPFKINKDISNKFFENDLFKLRPCPVNDPKVNTSKIKHWNLYPDVNKLNQSLIRKKYNIKEDYKIMFLSISKWSYKVCQKIGLMGYYKILFTNIFESLIKTNQKVFFFILHPEFNQEIINKNLTINFLNYMDYKEYNQILLSSDLVISDNIIQTSLSKAFIAGINTLAIVNYQENNYGLYKYNIFPLKVLYPDNRSYYKSIDKVDLFIKDQIFHKINLKLDDSNINTTKKQYLKNLKSLIRPNKIIESILN